MGKSFIGLNIGSITFSGDLVDENLFAVYPYFYSKIYDRSGVEVLLSHEHRDFLLDIPYDSITQGSNFKPPIFSAQMSEVSIKRDRGSIRTKISAAYVSATNYYANMSLYADYIYSNLYIAYLGSNLSASLSYKSYDQIDALAANEHLPILNKNLSYSAAYVMPIKNKEYSIELKARGRLSSIQNSAINLNTLPMIKVDGINGEDSVHYIDISGSLNFEKFKISYHNITNKGNQFGLIDDVSDVGGAFSLPIYSISDMNISIFHYLKVSWIFLD